MRASTQGGAACSRRASKQLCQQPTWRGAPMCPALATAVQLLQHTPRLASAPAVSSRTSNFASSVATANPLTQSQRQRHVAVPHNLPQSRTVRLLIACAADAQQAAEGSAAVADTNEGGSSPVMRDQPQTAEPQSTPQPAAARQSDDRKTSAAAAAAAALERLQQAAQRIQTATANPPSHTSRAAAAEASTDAKGHSGAADGVSTSTRSQQQQQLVQPIRPAQGREEALQQLEQQGSSHPDRLLTWRGRRSSTQQQPLQQQQLVQEQQQQHTGLPSQQQQQQQQQLLLPAPPLEPSIGPGGSTYLTSPVSFVAADTSTKALAGSMSIAFAVHQHQLMFAVGPHALAICCKALATARVMLALENDGRPVNILMQPTLRGGRTVRSQSYALDVARVGELPMQPGGGSSSDVAVVYGAPQQQQQRSSSSSSSGLSSTREQKELAADVKVVHITTTSNELAAARSLVENMPARGQTVVRVHGPFATETAVLAVALARPQFRQKYGQDLAVLVMWNENKMYRNKQSGLLLAVFRCAVGAFPPEVLLLPPSQRKLKRQQYWQQQQQKRQGK